MAGKFWTDAWSLVDGCTPVSEGCRDCWLKTMQERFGHGQGDFEGNAVFREDRLDIPTRVRVRKPRIFALWSDLYHENATNEQITAAFGAMAHGRGNGIILIITKRIERAVEFHKWLSKMAPSRLKQWVKVVADAEVACNEPIGTRGANEAQGESLVINDFYREKSSRDIHSFYPHWPLSHVWHIATMENQAMVDERMPHLLRIPGKRGIIIEPMLGPVDIRSTYIKARCRWGQYDSCVESPCPHSSHSGCQLAKRKMAEDIHQVIVGGETGTKARPMHPDWVRSVRDQCEAAGVPFFFKSWGEWGVDKPYDDKNPGGIKIYENGQWYAANIDDTDRTDVAFMRRVGKKVAGRLLDGREHNDLAWRI